MPICINAREYPGGVVAIDSGQFGTEMAACYLLEAGDRVAVVETGSRASAERILTVLARRGWSPAAVSHVIVTHVHLDHAGGAGHLLTMLPEAILVVHARGLRHLTDPSRLEASARQVFGDEAFDAQYGMLVPVPEGRTLVLGEGDRLQVGDRELEFIDTPGHARHHFCIWDRVTRGWFTGDTFGVSYRALDTAHGAFVFPTTTPVQFDPPALLASIDRLMERDPAWMYLTHFGRVGDTGRLARDLAFAVQEFVALAERLARAPERTRAIEDAMQAWLKRRCREHGVDLGEDRLEAILGYDVVLNTRGIEYWLDHRA